MRKSARAVTVGATLVVARAGNRAVVWATTGDHKGRPYECV